MNYSIKILTGLFFLTIISLTVVYFVRKSIVKKEILQERAGNIIMQHIGKQKVGYLDFALKNTESLWTPTGDFWKNKDWVELAAHGHYHQCEREDIGECEFFELDTEEKALQRISDCLSEWEKVGIKPSGWRNPGWLGHPNAVKVLGKYFDYSAIHQEHNHGLVWDCKTFEGEDGIHKTDSINIWNGNVFMFQSHIAGKTNDKNS